MRAQAERRTGWLRRRAGVCLMAVSVTGLLAGCTVFAEEEPAPAVITAETDNEQFPAVGSVPDAAPATTTAEERQVIIETLETDRAAANAPYEEQQVVVETIQTEPVVAGASDDFSYTQIETPPPAPSPPPVPTTAPIPTASSSSLSATPGTVSSGVPVTSSLPATQTLPTLQTAPQMAPQTTAVVETYNGPQMTAGGQVMVDYSAIGGQSAPLVPPGAPPEAYYGTTAGAYYGPSDLYGQGGPGEPVALIYFQNGSAALSSDDRKVIRGVADMLQANGGILRIVGHASMRTENVDPAEHDQVNYDMSLARANAVAQALMSEGVPSSRLQVAAAGSTDPEFYEFTPTGEAGNRRTEIYLVQ